MASGRKGDELVVITKTYDLILWSCHHTTKFPRNHRFVLGERIERNLYDFLELLIRAKYTKDRVAILEQANLVLEVLRFQMRLAKDLQCPMQPFARLFAFLAGHGSAFTLSTTPESRPCSRLRCWG
jgi:hypothetical protein